MRSILVTAALLLAAIPAAQAAETHCTLHYNMAGGGAFYKHSTGSGQITCDNGQHLAVTIESKGGGLTFGHSEIKDGVGKFSPVSDVHDLIGGYATAEANAGSGEASKAQVVTKGGISLALTGKGSGHTLGVSFGSFIISAAK
ncbi:hypothetical protein [Cognatiluteimonas telluris]|uniref:hypothetical protein n=1 Tax=Cognatiluteimonas telluris TaxID=1104775 RepID=UPI00140955F3|nr:hypothetical protein [Lysobacter telluris]